jgi:DNA-binding beta-propeller fold protein YncE
MEIRKLWLGAIWLALIALLGVGQSKLQRTAAAQGANKPQAPMFEVDPLWPKPLPNHWLLGSTIGVWVDDQDHIWIIHRSSATLDNNERGAELKPPTYECCVGAPPVLEFDQEGNLVHHWGGPGQGFEWPDSNHGIFVDHGGNVWIAGNGGPDGHILKFTKDGKFLAQFGKKGARPGPPATGGRGGATWRADSNDPANFGRPAKIFIDPKTNEAYIADGYLNRRVAVLDAQTGKMKRYWGAYGNKPDDSDLGPYDPNAPPAKQFRNPVHCAMLSKDGLVYVCDRQGDRLQVFRPDGTFQKELFIAKNTLASGSVWDIAFSSDPQQRFIYVSDGGNAKVHIVERATLQLLTSFGDGGRQPGQFFGVHSIATDSRGNLYTTETYEGKRLQKFVYRGLGPVTRPQQGVLWPRK